MARPASALLVLMVIPSFWGACSPGLSARDDAAGAGPDDGAGGSVVSSGGKSASGGGSGGKSGGSGGKSGGSGGKSASGGAAGAEPGSGGRASGGDPGSGGGEATCEEECPDNASCVAHDDSASCECDEGFEADESACVDIDECVEEEPCDENASCKNTEGSYECTCEDGFFGDGQKCVPRTRLVSVSLTGQASSSFNAMPSLSADGRFVAFYGPGDDLVSGDTNGEADIFVFDGETGKVSRVSVNSVGGEANGWSSGPSISGDGRYVAFTSNANNLVPNDLNGNTDVFRHDLVTGETIRISVSTGGAEAVAAAETAMFPTISDDGNRVSFTSAATNLVTSDTNDVFDQFVRDVKAGTTVRASLKSDGGQVGGPSTPNSYPTISGDGRYVVFASLSSELGGADDDYQDIFRRDLKENETRLVTYALPFEAIDNDSGYPSTSTDGRFVVFQSSATKLVPGDTNSVSDIFVRDMESGQIERVSVNSAGQQANGGSHLGSGRAISGDGRYVVFSSSATNLVEGDTNDAFDIFLRDRVAQTTIRVSVGPKGQQSTASSSDPTISANGKVVGFVTTSAGLGQPSASSFDQVWIRYLD